MKKLMGACCAAAMMMATSAIGAGIVISPPGHEIEKYYDFEQWTIYADDTRKSCLMSKVDSDGNVFQVGLAANNDYGYVGIFSNKGVKVEAGNSELAIIVNGNLYIGTGTGLTNIEGGYSGGYVISDNPMFAKDIMDSETLIAFPESANTYIVNLDGAKRALKTARKCNHVKGYKK